MALAREYPGQERPEFNFVVDNENARHLNSIPPLKRFPFRRLRPAPAEKALYTRFNVVPIIPNKDQRFLWIRVSNEYLEGKFTRNLSLAIDRIILMQEAIHG